MKLDVSGKYYNMQGIPGWERQTIACFISCVDPVFLIFVCTLIKRE